MELISDSRQVIRLSNKMIPLCFLFLMFNLHQTEAAPIADGCDKYLGNVSTSGPPSNYINYWNQVTLENNSKWINVEPQRNQYNWQPIKDAYDFCKQKGIPFKYHTFLWNEQYPSWLDGLSAADKKAEVEELIRLVGQKFPDIAYMLPTSVAPNLQSGKMPLAARALPDTTGSSGDLKPRGSTAQKPNCTSTNTIASSVSIPWRCISK
jgi:hypothetical protein